MDKSTRWRLLALSILIAGSSLFLPGCGLIYLRHRPELATPVNPSDQPDKILFDKATSEIARGRYDVGRLTLQTLINTYPDSEFLAKAKLAIADSYYNEGGISGLTQADAEYKDFITFFPTAPEAPEAQFRVGMAHYRLMAKADRDRTEARLAEVEFKEFLLKYPDSPLMPRVKARFRETQEVLGQAEFKSAEFYYMRGSYLASRSRLQDIVDKYPDYSGGDKALYYLAKSYEHLRIPQKAVPYYARILTDFPLSPYTKEAKRQLMAMHQPIPRPTRAMLARAQADAARRQHRDLLAKMSSIMSSGPDTSATLRGPVHLGGPPPGEAEMAKTSPGTAGAGKATVVAQPVSDASLSAGKPLDPQTGSTQSAENANAKPQEASSNDQSAASPDASTSPKKKGRFHILKKLVKPF
jgi:outer membrane protein assembly factor BamD